jgi:hypothetical protein
MFIVNSNIIDIIFSNISPVSFFPFASWDSNYRFVSIS